MMLLRRYRQTNVFNERDKGLTQLLNYTEPSPKI
jgi:hypothetical protein